MLSTFVPGLEPAAGLELDPDPTPTPTPTPTRPGRRPRAPALGLGINPTRPIDNLGKSWENSQVSNQHRRIRDGKI